MIPAPPTKQRAPCDTECYPNYWLFGIQLGPTVWQCEAVGQGARLAQADRDRIVWLLDNVPIWTFNGNGYDNWLIAAAAVAGMSVEQLKGVNDKIIVERVKPWQLSLPRWQPKDHIDIMEVIPGAGGQKYKAGMIHYSTMRDLPYSPGTHLTAEQMREVRQYNANDLGQLAALAEAVAPQIRLREKLTERYGIDLRSKSDAQVAEAVLKHRCEQALGRRIEKHSPDKSIRFRYEPPAYLQFESPTLRALLSVATSDDFHIGDSKKGDGDAILGPEALTGYKFDLNGLQLTAGVGGMHSREKCAAHVADEETMLEDIDVEAYYPSMMLNANAWPEALGPQFLVEFGALKAERVAAKGMCAKLEAAGVTCTIEYDDSNTTNSGGKIMINATFGKTGSLFSILCAPKMMIQTTLTGQLSLLLLIEWMQKAGVQVVSVNTDGIVCKFPRKMHAVMRAVVKRWEDTVGLKMEANEYRALYSASVNDYMAIKAKDGKVKRKGQYAPTSLIGKKAPDVEICADACAAYVGQGVPVEVTILSCADIRKFVSVKNVAGGAAKLRGDGPRPGVKVADMLTRLAEHGWAKKGARWQLDGCTPVPAADAYAAAFPPQVREEIGKVIRYYYSTQAPGPIVYASGKKAGHRVPDSWGAQPCMVLPGSLPTDIDYGWYIGKAYSMLRECGAIV